MVTLGPGLFGSAFIISSRQLSSLNPPDVVAVKGYAVTFHLYDKHLVEGRI
jgi:hypothetical protein